MIKLEVFGESSATKELGERLDNVEGVRRVRVHEAVRKGHAVLIAEVRPGRVDAVFETVRRRGVPESSVTLTRMDLVGSLTTGSPEASLVWTDVLGTAWLNARPIARYLAFMIVAGVIGCYGVIDNNAILIVGAMAVAPDLLPITAIGVGVVGREPGLAARALLTLAVGLGVSAVAAAVVSFILDQLELLPSGFNIQQTGVLESLTSVSNETIVVAFVAGVAGMLALETRASSGVGVAISVTTIPVAAYLGVALGIGELGKATSSLGVLGANVALMVLGAVVTLALQAMLKRRAGEYERRAPPG